MGPSNFTIPRDPEKHKHIYIYNLLHTIPSMTWMVAHWWVPDTVSPSRVETVIRPSTTPRHRAADRRLYAEPRAPGGDVAATASRASACTSTLKTWTWTRGAPKQSTIGYLWIMWCFSPNTAAGSSCDHRTAPVPVTSSAPASGRLQGRTTGTSRAERPARRGPNDRDDVAGRNERRSDPRGSQ